MALEKTDKDEILEVIQDLAQLMGDGFSRLENKVDRLDTRVGGLEVRFDGLEERFDGLEDRAGGLEKQIIGLDGSVGGLEHEIRSMKSIQNDHTVALTTLQQSVDRLEKVSTMNTEDIKELYHLLEKIEKNIRLTQKEQARLSDLWDEHEAWIRAAAPAINIPYRAA